MKTAQNGLTLANIPPQYLPFIPRSLGRSPMARQGNASDPETQSIVIARTTREAGLMLYELLGMVELMHVAYEKGEMEIAQNRLEIIMQESAKLSSTLSTILEFTRMDSKQTGLSSRYFDIALLLEEISHAARLFIQSKPVKVMDASCETPIFIHSDFNKLKRIMMSLVSNAAKFTNRGRIALIVSKEKDEIKLTVADTGKGMTQEQINAVHESSDQAYDVGKSNTETISSGLRLVQALVKQLHGSLSIASKIGEGTIVVVSLPIS